MRNASTLRGVANGLNGMGAYESTLGRSTSAALRTRAFPLAHEFLFCFLGAVHRPEVSPLRASLSMMDSDTG